MSDNTTPEPERLLLNADFSTTRHEEWEPDDGSAEHERQRREKLNRERELLLTTFDPSEFGFPSDSGSFAALAEHVRNRDEPTDLPERPVSSEETSG